MASEYYISLFIIILQFIGLNVANGTCMLAFLIFGAGKTYRLAQCNSNAYYVYSHACN